MGRALALSLGITGCRVVSVEGGSGRVRQRHKVTQLVVSGWEFALQTPCTGDFSARNETNLEVVN